MKQTNEQTAPINKPLVLIAIILSIGLLLPGILLPLMTIKAEINQESLVAHSKHVIKQQQLPPMLQQLANGFLDSVQMDEDITLLNKTQSILKTSQSLWQQDYPVVALLIIIFSTIIPVIKILLLIALLIFPCQKIVKLNGFLSKWSMADVFAIGVLISFLMAAAAENAHALIVFEAILHAGFYWFVAYCLTSVILGQILLKSLKQPAT
ncbi:MAG: paraquat-inducible protein A [Cellvibrionales bacterium]|nr:paraquat-inducible protein A [Cellvibrionales bacterium]